MNESGFGISNEFGAHNSGMRASFYLGCVIDTEATLKAGRDIYKDVPFVMLSCDGGKRQITKQAKPEIIKQYSAEYLAFQNEVKRMPLWILHLKPHQIKDLEHYGIKSVEDFQTVPCPEGYERFAQAAQIINQLRDEHENQENTVRSSGHSNRERQNIRAEEVQQNQNIASISREETRQKEGKKESFQEINYSFDYGNFENNTRFGM